jgi:hypothetical protein
VSVIEGNRKLKSLDLQYNLISKTSFALSLVRNECLEKLMLSYNPLTFDNLMSLLEMLMNNRTLVHLALQGVHLEGPAPIKENCHGHLSSKEAVVLKLASVLRYSSVSELSVDVDLSATPQLQELESTLVKHNRALLDLNCEGFNLSTPLPQPLLNIQRALKANRVLAEGCPQDDYPELEGFLRIKASAVRSSIPDSFVNVGEVSESLTSRQLRNSSSILIDSPTPDAFSLQQALSMNRLSEDFTDAKGPASTPQFSSIAHPQRRFSQQTRLEELLETPNSSLKRTPSPLGATIATEPNSHYRTSSLQFEQLHSALKVLDHEVTRHLGNISNRQTTLEDRLALLQEEVGQLNEASVQKIDRVERSSSACLSKTQRILMSLEQRLQELESHLGQQTQLDLDALRHTQRQHSLRLEQLSQNKDNIEESFIKLNDAQTQSSARLESLQMKRSSPDTDVLVLKQQEEDRSNTKACLLRLEIQETETARLARQCKHFHKEVTSKLTKLDLQDKHNAQTLSSRQVDSKFKQLELRLGGIEEAFNRWGHESKGSCPSSLRNSVLKENERSKESTKGKVAELSTKLERFEDLLPTYDRQSSDRCKPLERCLAREDFSALRNSESQLRRTPDDSRRELTRNLPREAEGVVLNAIICQSSRPKTSRPRSCSSMAFHELEVPSQELADSLRRRGFDISDRCVTVVKH